MSCLLTHSFFSPPSIERRRRDAISAATCLTEALVDHLNVGYEILTSAQLMQTACESRWRSRKKKNNINIHTQASYSLCSIIVIFPSSVAQAYVNQRKLDHEVKTLQVQASQFSKQTAQWISMVEGFNQALKVCRKVMIFLVLQVYTNVMLMHVHECF